MFRTYLKFAARTFRKDKFYTLLNIIGLATGIAVSIIILLYLQNDLTYDRHHTQHRQIYRLVTNMTGPGVEFHSAGAAREVAPLLADDYPEVLSFVRFEDMGRTLVNVPGAPQPGAPQPGSIQPGSIQPGAPQPGAPEFGANEALYNEDDWLRADSTVFKVFTHSFLAGDPATALREKNSVVLTTTLARKYFGDQEALGQTLLLFEEQTNHTVTGVIEDLPDNTHLKFEALVVLASLLASPIAYWLIDRWLQAFAYRTDINVFLFVLAGAAALLVAFVTMSFHSLKTARLNPVESLRYE